MNRPCDFYANVYFIIMPVHREIEAVFINDHDRMKL